MAQSFYLLEQAERCRRLAQDSNDPALRESLLNLAEEYAVRANAQENDDRTVWQAGSNDQDD
jgi:hypothetical protein